MKDPRQVGRDFDEYISGWRSEDYGIESSWEADGVVRSEETRPQCPGDEWGSAEALRQLYGSLLKRVLPSGPVSVLEIGPGGGRATALVLDELDERIVDYQAVDVSPKFIEVLERRIGNAVTVHEIEDVDLSALPTDHFDLCLSQSAWSHIHVYDQYRYLRDLRRVMRHRAPVIVNGLFFLGVGRDWSWNRFRRRVYQMENRVPGVFHEFTGVGVVVEQLRRLEYEIDLIHDEGFVVRPTQRNPEAYLEELDRPLSFPYRGSLLGWANDGEAKRINLT